MYTFGDGYVLAQSLTCPMTLGLINDPAATDDGHVYERTASNVFVVIGFAFSQHAVPFCCCPMVNGPITN